MFLKKNCIYLTILTFIFIFAGCTQPASSSSSDDDNSYNYSPAQIAELKGYYSKLIGTTWENEQLNNQYALYPKNVLTISFADDSVTINNVRYAINQNTDLYFNDKVTDEILKEDEISVFFLKINNNFYGFRNYLLDNSSYNDNYMDIDSVLNGNFCSETLIPSTGGGGSGNNNTIAGSYSFNNATGSQSNGTITLSDGNWTYSGSKSNPAASSGTYTVNGSKITVSWTASGYNNSETFTVTTSGSSSTWKSENTGVSLLFSMLFGTTSLEMTFNFAE